MSNVGPSGFSQTSFDPASAARSMNGAGLPAATITGMVAFVGDTDSIQPFQ
jgi:hypothetical protein